MPLCIYRLCVNVYVCIHPRVSVRAESVINQICLQGGLKMVPGRGGGQIEKTNEQQRPLLRLQGTANQGVAGQAGRVGTEKSKG